jgi:vacuolar iron transporter family protein
MRFSIHEKGEYLAKAVLAASDGIVTTFAVVAGSAGASFDQSIVIILGFANLFADGFSMAAGNYLGVKSEIEYEEAKGEKAPREGLPVFHGLVTFIGFDLAGLIPLLPFIFHLPSAYGLSTVLVGISLFTVGAARSFYTRKSFSRSGFEMLTIGGFAALVAFVVGYIIENFVLRG